MLPKEPAPPSALSVHRWSARGIKLFDANCLLATGHNLPTLSMATPPMQFRVLCAPQGTVIGAGWDREGSGHGGMTLPRAEVEMINLMEVERAWQT